MKTFNGDFRDPADKIGSVLGFFIGLCLVSVIFWHHDLSNLTLNGQDIPSSPFSHIVLCLLLVGVCVNLSRNLAVGMHDAFIFIFKCYKNIFKKTKN